VTDDQAPWARIEDSDRLREAAREVVSIVDERLADLSSRRELMPRHFAALGLARCNRLLTAMFALFDGELQDAGGVYARPIFETMIVSLYSLYGGETAYEEVRGAYVQQVERFSNIELLGEASKRLVEGWEGPKNRLNIEQLARRVGELLQAEGGASSPETGQMIYDILYRGESLVGIHAGIGSVVGHLEDHGNRLGVARVRQNADDGTGELVLSAVNVIMLAYHVFKTFGIGTARLEAVWNQLTEGTTADALVVEREPTFKVDP